MRRDCSVVVGRPGEEEREERGENARISIDVLVNVPVQREEKREGENVLLLTAEKRRAEQERERL